MPSAGCALASMSLDPSGCRTESRLCAKGIRGGRVVAVRWRGSKAEGSFPSQQSANSSPQGHKATGSMSKQQRGSTQEDPNILDALFQALSEGCPGLPAAEAPVVCPALFTRLTASSASDCDVSRHVLSGSQIFHAGLGSLHSIAVSQLQCWKLC
jgi:hypothetical protein